MLSTVRFFPFFLHACDDEHDTHAQKRNCKSKCKWPQMAQNVFALHLIKQILLPDFVVLVFTFHLISSLLYLVPIVPFHLPRVSKQTQTQHFTTATSEAELDNSTSFCSQKFDSSQKKYSQLHIRIEGQVDMKVILNTKDTDYSKV